VRATIWGCRGSLATPGEETVRYGGNTTCIELRTSDDDLLVVDAGTGIRRLGGTLFDGARPLDLVLTHLHLDHVEGLGFFAPLFDEGREIRIWGPAQDGSSLEARLRTYLSPPYFPVPFERIPSRVEFIECGPGSWTVGGVTVTAAVVQHPGDTLAYRFEADGRSFAFIPDNELGLDPESGAPLADTADLLFHDAQYTQEEYRSRVGWGHTALEDLAPFLRTSGAERVVMFHHDPSHRDSDLETMRATAEELAGREVELAREGCAYDV